jgi:DNA-binding PadR family transcriptional regulator
VTTPRAASPTLLRLLILQIVSSSGRLDHVGLATRIERIPRDVLVVHRSALYRAMTDLERGGLVAARWDRSRTSRDTKPMN